jgi:hypothetical protein
MSADADTHGPTEPGLASDTRDDFDDMLDTLDAAIEEAQRKVEEGRIRDAENEKVRIKWIQALVRAVDVKRRVVNDSELAEVAEEVERLQETTGQ